MGRRLPQEPAGRMGEAEAREMEAYWLGLFLWASEAGTRAAAISAEVRDARGLKARWAVIERHGLVESAERHLHHMRNIRDRSARRGTSAEEVRRLERRPLTRDRFTVSDLGERRG